MGQRLGKRASDCIDAFTFAYLIGRGYEVSNPLSSIQEGKVISAESKRID